MRQAREGLLDWSASRSGRSGPSWGFTLSWGPRRGLNWLAAQQTWIPEHSVLLVLFSILYYVLNMTILKGLFLSRSFQFLWVLHYSQNCLHPPQEVVLHRASKINWSVPIWDYLTSLFNKRQRKRDYMTAMRRRKLNFRWWLVRLLCLSSGLDYQNVGGGETFNITALHKWGVAHQTSNHLPKFNL